MKMSFLFDVMANLFLFLFQDHFLSKTLFYKKTPFQAFIINQLKSPSKKIIRLLSQCITQKS